MMILIETHRDIKSPGPSLRKKKKKKSPQEEEEDRLPRPFKVEAKIDIPSYDGSVDAKKLDS